MRYLVTLKPMGSYFFGGEVTLGDGTTQNYYVKSNLLPQPSALLGLMRYEVLRQHKLLSYNPENEGTLERVEELIGKGSFSLSDSSRTYGIIQSISPVFLCRDSDKNFYMVEPVDIDRSLSPTEPVKPVEMVHKANRCSYSGKDKGELKQMFVPSFDVKNHDYNTYWCDNLFNRLDRPFALVEQIGITKNGRKENEKDAFFKQVSVKLDSSLSMAFTIDIQDGKKFEAGEGMVFLGGNRSMFKMTVSQENVDFKEHFKSLHVEGRLLALGDAYLNDEDKWACDFIWGESMPLRYMEQASSQKHSWRKPKKSLAYQLQIRGSVLYGNDSCLKKLCEESEFHHLGLNVFV